MTAAADGAFVVAWNSYGGGVSRAGRRHRDVRHGIFARQFDSAGTFLGTEFQVNTYTSGDQDYPALGIADDGQRLVVVWDGSTGKVVPPQSSPTRQAERLGALLVDLGSDGSGSAVFGQLYGPTETPTLTPTHTPTATPTLTQTATPTDTGLPGGPGGPPVGGGDEPGSKEVTGTGPPNRDPGCLKVYEVGANRVPDGGNPDDMLLGSGGTDANGNFSIMLSRPLKSGDVIFIVDTCASPPTSGPVDLITGAAPGPGPVAGPAAGRAGHAQPDRPARPAPGLSC